MDAFAYQASAAAPPPAMARGRTAPAPIDDADDRDILFALLSPCLGCMEAAEAVEALIARYGGVEQVVVASPADLAALPELGEAGAAALRAVLAVAQRLDRMRRRRRPVLTHAAGWGAHLRRAGMGVAAGEIRALFLDPRGVLLAEETVGEGGAAAAPGRAIRRALALEADGIVLACGSEGGDPVASESDIAMARSLDQAAQVMGLRLRDVLVVGRAGHASLREAGAV